MSDYFPQEKTIRSTWDDLSGRGCACFKKALARLRPKSKDNLKRIAMQNPAQMASVMGGRAYENVCENAWLMSKIDNRLLYVAYVMFCEMPQYFSDEDYEDVMSMFMNEIEFPEYDAMIAEGKKIVDEHKKKRNA